MTTLPQTEAQMQLAVCDWLRQQWPGVIFNSDGAGNNLPPVQAAINTRLRSGRGYPDLFIAEPVGKWAGLFLELKREGTTVWLKSGEVAADPHLREQVAVLEALEKKGYRVDIAVGFNEAVWKIKAYLSGQA